MIKKLHNIKQIVITLLLAGFISVFVCDALCDFELISWGNYPAFVKEADHHSIKDQKHEHHDVANDHHHEDSQPDDGGQEDECCDEEVKNLYASLIKYEIRKLPVETPVFQMFYEVFAINFKEKNFNQQLLPFLFTNLPPPLSGIHIRIFIQSFLN
ncbi:hypothetical protein [Cyclobacterium marinum]|uniref:hypothetical protein n=1 Tax=Cyclobacterium marinum TaxID=104 RepID=UPI0011ED663A|nr:hypothetical protein [Cyclobacterium marinum]MBI0398119.1 hypothetical protein [Cyclobacterium marinum]